MCLGLGFVHKYGRNVVLRRLYKQISMLLTVNVQLL